MNGEDVHRAIADSQVPFVPDANELSSTYLVYDDRGYSTEVDYHGNVVSRN